jgi:hypothetical protein
MLIPPAEANISHIFLLFKRVYVASLTYQG